MVDYVAVLRRTIDALPKNTPEIRERVYAKARTTVESKLAMISPPPSAALIAKQMSGLDAAIATVEADFAVALEAHDAPIVKEADPLADILNALPNVKDTSVRDAARAALPETQSNADVFSTPAAVRETFTSEFPPIADTQIKRVDAFPFDMPDLPDRPRLPDAATLDFPELPDAPKPTPRTNDSFDDVFGDSAPAFPPRVKNPLPPLSSLDEPVMPPQFVRPKRPQPKRGRMLLPLLGLALLAGAGALAWTEREQIIALLQPEQAPVVVAQPDAPVEPATPTEPAATPAEPAATPAIQAEPATQKFTQRLNADGTEVDAGTGVAGGEQSVAQLEPAAEPATPTPPAAPAEPETPAVETPAVDPAATPETPVVPAAETPATPAEAIPVGQKAIFYEERTSGAEGSARTGAVVWSVVRESPGNDKPPEPAVRGELTIPEAGLNVRMTLRRNADATLPASHILELIMTVPEDFAGGTIEDVQRVNMKPTEESAGAALAATPVKVADKFFLVALENAPAAIEANLKLLREQSWIDLPVVYRSGRRALFTMEKGLVGDKVFKEVLDAWVAAPLQ
jgi:hypothetical protein